jgi:hypothetical protein
MSDSLNRYMGNQEPSERRATDLKIYQTNPLTGISDFRISDCRERWSKAAMTAICETKPMPTPEETRIRNGIYQTNPCSACQFEVPVPTRGKGEGVIGRKRKFTKRTHHQGSQISGFQISDWAVQVLYRFYQTNPFCVIMAQPTKTACSPFCTVRNMFRSMRVGRERFTVARGTGNPVHPIDLPA